MVHSVAVNAEEVTVAKADSSFEGLRGQIEARQEAETEKGVGVSSGLMFIGGRFFR